MSTSDQESDISGSKYETHVGSVIGPVHAGKGDINVGTFNVSSTVTISNRDEFLQALQKLAKELDAARQYGLQEEVADDTVIEVEAAEREAKKELPKLPRVVKRLEKAKALLVAGTGVATATAAAVAAANQLVPLIESAIQAASKIFGM